MEKAQEKAQEIATLAIREQEQDEWAVALVNFLSEKCRNTSVTYKRAISNFFNTMHVRPDKVTLLDVSAYKQMLKKDIGNGRPAANSTIGLHLAALASFYGYCCDPEKMQGRPLVDRNFFKVIGRRDIAVSKFGRARMMSLGNFKAILNQIDRSTTKGQRDYALLVFYFHAGRRSSEIARLQYRDIEFGTGEEESHYRYTGKGTKTRKKVLPVVVSRVLREYLASHKDIKPEDHIFQPINRWAVARKNKNERQLARPMVQSVPSITSRSVLRIVKHYAKKAGVSVKEVTAHSIRHLAAYTRSLMGADIFEIQTLLDHSRLDTTQIYMSTVIGTKDIDRSCEIEKMLEKQASVV